MITKNHRSNKKLKRKKKNNNSNKIVCGCIYSVKIFCSVTNRIRTQHHQSSVDLPVE